MELDLKGYKLILASNSIRRKEFLERMKIPFKVKNLKVDESYPKSLKGSQIVKYIVNSKAKAAKNDLKKKQIIIVADTIVWHNGKSLGKPKDKKDARKMIETLSGKTHSVITAVGFIYKKNFDTLIKSTKVTFKVIEEDEIKFYVEKYNPIDKAGSYGIQDWLGEIAVEKINGSYTNVVGLPSAQVYQKIKTIVKD